MESSVEILTKFLSTLDSILMTRFPFEEILQKKKGYGITVNENETKNPWNCLHFCCWR